MPEHHQQLLEANLRAKKIYAAAKLASFNGWSIGAFAALSLPFALSSLLSLAIEIGLLIVAYNEFRGRNRLRCFEPAALGLL